MKLKDKVAIVTGAAGGIGRAHALRLARLGADVVINDIDLEAFKKYGEKITEDSVPIHDTWPRNWGHTESP